MAEPAPACWICASRRATVFKANNGPAQLRPEDLRISDDRYGVTLGLWRCEACEFVYADRAEVDNLTELYAALEDPDYLEGEASRARQMRWLVELARSSHPGARCGLDIGAASGLLVHEAAAAGLEMVGVEPSHSLVEVARRERGVDVLQGVYPHPELEGRRFDLVFLVDVIEHVSEPVDLLASCRAALAPGGRALVVTPDIGSPTARLLGRRWWHLRLAHVGYFNSRSFARAASEAGLRVLAETRARWFFPAGYLARRVEQYLPVRWLNNLVEATPLLRRSFDLEIPLNLHDSTVFSLEAR